MLGQIAISTPDLELKRLKPLENPPQRITSKDRAARLQALQARLKAEGVPAVLINASPSLKYFTGIGWGQTERLIALLVPQQGTPWLIGPNFELGSLQAMTQVPVQFRLWHEHENPMTLVLAELETLGANHVALEATAPFWIASGLLALRPDLILSSAAPLIDPLRQIKSPAELALMQHAMSITYEAHRAAAKILHEGITTNEVRAFIDEAHRRLGADSGNTFCAVQFGRATAYPHGLPGEQTLKSGDLVLIDTGTLYDGYHSDITRTYGFGPQSSDIARLWILEKTAQAAAFAAVKPGIACEAIDAAARRVLESHGLGPDYDLPGLPHRTGHGIGLSIHEAAYLVRGDKTPLAPGMCFSNEPMIVMPDQFGIRLEDHFYVTETGANWFTPPSESLYQPFTLEPQTEPA